ncbi:MAG: 50S ribosomal protein L5 [Candidatus Margulisbacteria bacterium]|nr:50S ribosomal protein L5 [Candidatus Margulisiibacteriota bacterium]
MVKQQSLDLKEKYKLEIKKALQEKFTYVNANQVPKIEKIVINRGLGEAISNSKVVQASVDEFMTLFGQKPIVTKAKKSIAGFKLREGLAIGCKVTLRGDRMYEFMNKLFNLVLPKIRDFRGVSVKAFDKQANYTLGIREQIIFPEIDYDKVDKVRGFNITFVTSTENVEESLELLSLLGMPFRK